MFSIFNLLYQASRHLTALGLTVWLDLVSRTAPLLLAQWKVSSRWGLRMVALFFWIPACYWSSLKDFARLFGTLFHTWLATTRLEWLPSPTMICIRSLFAGGKEKVNFDPDWYWSWLPQVYRCHLMQLCQSPRIGMGRRFWVESGRSTGWTLDRAKPQPWYDTSVGLLL